MLLVVISAATGVLPLLHATLLGAVLTVVTGVLTPAEARAGVNLDVVLLIVGSIGLGRAVLVSGLGDRLATGLVRVTAVGGAHAAFAGVVVATMLLTELIGHSASAALMFPIALSTSGRAGVDPRAFALSVAVAASSSFLTPIGHQVNMMVYGPGGYRFRDYTRLGTPLAILVAVATIVLGPLVWPF
jgi:di/tricarboxylate transporter